MVLVFPLAWLQAINDVVFGWRRAAATGLAARLIATVGAGNQEGWGVTAGEIAARFKAFCGEEQFRLFVTELNTGPAGEEGRLQEWQASLWKRFVASEPEAIPASEADVFEILNVCHVHLCHLSQGRAPIVYGLVRSHPDYPTGHGERFPLANIVVLGGCIVGSETHEDVTYCAECRRELRRLQDEQGGS